MLRQMKAIMTAAGLIALANPASADRASFNDMLRYAQATAKTSEAYLVKNANVYVNELAPKLKAFLSLLKSETGHLQGALAQVAEAVTQAESAPQDPARRGAAQRSFDKPLRVVQGFGRLNTLSASVATYRKEIAADAGRISLRQASLEYWIRFNSGQLRSTIFGTERDPGNPEDNMPHPMRPQAIPSLRNTLAQLAPLPPLNAQALAASELFQNCVNLVVEHQSAFEAALTDARDHIPDYRATKARLAAATASQKALTDTVTLCGSATMWGE